MREYATKKEVPYRIKNTFESSHSETSPSRGYATEVRVFYEGNPHLNGIILSSASVDKREQFRIAVFYTGCV